MQWIMCVRVASNFLFRLSARHVGCMHMNMQVQLLNLLVCVTGWKISELVGLMCDTKQVMFNSIHNVKILKCLAFCLFPLLARITECSLAESQNASKEITVLARIIECLEIKIVSAVTWISLSIKFVVMRQRWKRNPRQTVPWPATGITQNKVLVLTDWLLLVFNAWLTDYSCISLWLHLQLLQWLHLCITVHATLYSNNKWM